MAETLDQQHLLQLPSASVVPWYHYGLHGRDPGPATLAVASCGLFTAMVWWWSVIRDVIKKCILLSLAVTIYINKLKKLFA